MNTNHTHECRGCGNEIDCTGTLDRELYCDKWQGGADGCDCEDA